MRHMLIPRRSMIGSFVGNMFSSNPEDIKKTRRNFATIGRYNGDTELEYIDRELDQTIRTFQIDNGLKQDGVMRPNGETENALNRGLQSFRNNSLQNAFDVRPALELSDNVGNLQINKPEDVKQVQKELSRIKLLPENRLRNLSGILDGQTDQAIKEFQFIRGLRVDGMLSPRGETEKMFNSALSSENDDAPTPDKPEPPQKDDDSKEPDNGDDKKEPEEIPIPPRKPEPPQDDEPKEPEEKPDCEDLEIALTNAEAALFIANQNLENAQEEKQSLETSISADEEKIQQNNVLIQNKQQELQNINSEIEKEKKDRKNARKAGREIFGVLGKRLPGGKKVGAILGDAAGIAFEENLDLFTEDTTTLNLLLQRSRIVEEINVLQEKISASNQKNAEPKAKTSKLQNRINDVLWPAVKNASQIIDEARAELETCQNSKE